MTSLNSSQGPGVRTPGPICLVRVELADGSKLAEQTRNSDHNPGHEYSEAGEQQKITQDYCHEGPRSLPCKASLAS